MTISEYLQNQLVVKQVSSHNHLLFKDKLGDTIDFQKFVDAEVPEFKNGAIDYLSPVLFNGHLQTCFTTVRKFDDIDVVNYKRYMMTYPDGGEGALDIIVPEFEPSTYIPPTQLAFQPPLEKNYSYGNDTDSLLKSDDDKPMLVALHGLTGGSHESYVRSIVSRLTSQHGFEACVLNSRGCCQSQITTPQLYNGGWTNDINFVMNQLFQMYPNRSFYMIGFSLGASILSNYVGEQNSKISSRVKCAMVFGNPWDLLRSDYYLNDTRMGANLYSPALARNCVNLVKRHATAMSKKPGFQEIYDKSIDTLKTANGFDDVFTGPFFNYKDSKDYYGDASSFKRLAGVRVPLIGLNAMDDPIAGGDNLPEEQVMANPYTMLVETNIGGHLAWFKDIYGTRWFSEPVATFFSKFHSEVIAKGYEVDISEEELPHEVVKNVRTTIVDQ